MIDPDEHGSTERNTRKRFLFVCCWNLSCPLLFKYIMNYQVIPLINDYISNCTLYFNVLPPIEEMRTPTAYILVLLLSIKYKWR